jgi:hypothetical protein
VVQTAGCRLICPANRPDQQAAAVEPAQLGGGGHQPCKTKFWIILAATTIPTYATPTLVIGNGYRSAEGSM